jgi:succinylglutamate desuccinylase
MIGCASTESFKKGDDPIFAGKSLEEHLSHFASLEKKYPGPFAKSISIQLGSQSSPHLFVGCMIHGDEIGCLPAVNDFFNSTIERSTFKGTLTVFIGNPKAAFVKKRFIEQDLNRVFTNSAPDSSEKLRAQEIMKHLGVADLFIDFHQTIEPTSEPFYTFAFSEASYFWARYLQGAKTLVLTLELSQKGFNDEADKITKSVLTNAVLALSLFKNPKSIAEIKKLALKSPKLILMKRSHAIPFEDSGLRLNPGFMNFSKIEKDSILGTRSNGDSWVAGKEGWLLFPKYPERDQQGKVLGPLPSDIVLIVEKAKEAEFLSL